MTRDEGLGKRSRRQQSKVETKVGNEEGRG